MNEITLTKKEVALLVLAEGNGQWILSDHLIKFDGRLLAGLVRAGLAEKHIGMEGVNYRLTSKGLDTILAGYRAEPTHAGIRIFHEEKFIGWFN